ncbi:MAG: hypothetical protein KDK48_00430 [Chlamydiia bacterium]|nr:hypothetical protein [Chlamydiia bacterium]
MSAPLSFTTHLPTAESALLVIQQDRATPIVQTAIEAVKAAVEPIRPFLRLYTTAEMQRFANILLELKEQILHGICRDELEALESVFKPGEKLQPKEAFDHLKTLCPEASCEEAKLPENFPFNRYGNILPYDFNRVKLRGYKESDYVSASRMALPTDYHCIAASAPEGDPEQLCRFLHMILQEEVETIVVTTDDVEGFEDKCYPYWVDFELEGYGVECRKEKKLADLGDYKESLVKRTLLIKGPNGQKRSVEMLHLQNWPDFGAADPEIVKALCLSITCMEVQTTLYHCSAGVGRTGVVLGAYLGYRMMLRGEEINLLGLVQTMREQRAGMVQRECQLACIEKTLSLFLESSE